MTRTSNSVRDVICHSQDAEFMRPPSVEEIRRSIADGRKEGGGRPADEVFDDIEAMIEAMPETPRSTAASSSLAPKRT